MNSRIAMGQHLVTGFEGPAMTPEFIEQVREWKIGNVILFENNVVNCEQLRKLCADITRLITEETGIPPFITIDQEGGAVSRLKEDAAIFPGAMAVAAAGKPENARIAGRITGLELRSLGVNFDYAPVADVNNNPRNPVIGVRSYGDDPEKAAEYVIEMMRGLTEGGVLSSLKHFPGHGDTAVDSHLGLPKVDKSLEELEKCELLPFRRAIEAGAPAVMTAHILYPQLEPDDIPATMSRRIITGLLREKLGFDGLVVSDSMMMAAIAKYYGRLEGTLAAVRAGVDLVIVSHDAVLTGKAVAMLEQTVADDPEVKASTERILDFKRRMPAPIPTEVGCAAHRNASRSITENAVTLVHDAPFALGDSPMFLGCYRFRPTLVSSPEDSSLSFAHELQKLLGGRALATPQNPAREEIDRILEACEGASSVTIGTYNGLLRPGQMELVRGAAELGLPCCCVALRNPYDLACLPDNVRTIAAYDYDVRTLPVIAEILSGRREARGRLPVKLN